MDDNQDKQINLEKIDLINKINNKRNNLDEIYNKSLETFKKKSFIELNSNETPLINQFNNFSQPEDANLVQYKDLVTKSKK